jgi:DNA-binding beta-propeller fold protein YncE
MRATWIARCATLAALLAAVLPAPAGAQNRNRPQAADASAPAWPAPPAQPRIRFLRSLEPASVRKRPTLLTKLVTLLVGDEPPPVMAQPYGMAVGDDRRVYVADTVGGVVHVYDLEKRSYSAIHLTAQSLIGIAAVGRRLYVTDSAADRLLCVDLKGRVIWSRGVREGFVRPTGIVASADRLFVVDTLAHRIAIVAPNGDVLGHFGIRGDGPGQFNFPTNIARAADGRLFVTDSMNFRVQMFDPEGRFVRSFGKLGDGWGDFDKPKGVAVDSVGHVYVVEGLNDIVQIFDDTGRLLLVFGGSGTGVGRFWLPSGIVIVDDVVYVADTANHRVQMFEFIKERS